jgi:hypothetical protein
VPSVAALTPGQVVIAIDPHKASWTAVAVDTRLQPLASIRVAVNRDGYRQLRRSPAAGRTRAGRSRVPQVWAPR